MRPPVRPPRLRCGLFPSIYLPHLLVLPATFGLQRFSPPYPYFPALYVVSVRQVRGLPTASFRGSAPLGISPHGEHPCCSAMCFVVAYAHSGLSPVRARPWRANKKQSPCSHLCEQGDCFTLCLCFDPYDLHTSDDNFDLFQRIISP